MTTTVTRIRSNLQSLLDAGGFSSGGHIAYFLSERSSDVLVDLVLLLKVEDWMTGCIPNTLHEDTEERMSYISDREEKMSQTLQSKLGNGTIIYDRHVKHLGVKPRGTQPPTVYRYGWGVWSIPVLGCQINTSLMYILVCI